MGSTPNPPSTGVGGFDLYDNFLTLTLWEPIQRGKGESMHRIAASHAWHGYVRYIHSTYMVRAPNDH